MAEDHQPIVPIEQMIDRAATDYKIDPKILRGLLMAESSLNPNAVGPGGELGIGQFTAGTARMFGIDPRDPSQAIPAAAKYLRMNLDQFGGDYNKAVAAYNWGPGNVARQGLAAAPQSVRDYVAKVTGGAPPSTGGTSAAQSPATSTVPLASALTPGAPAQPTLASVQSQFPMPPPWLNQPGGGGIMGAPTSLADAFVRASQMGRSSIA